MLPTDQALTQCTLPFTLHPLQVADVNALAPLPRSGWWDEVGTGKTVMATLVALFKRLQARNVSQDLQVLVLMPPALLAQWRHWLLEVCQGDSVLVYRGTPKERASMGLTAHWILMSLDIFKRDYERIRHELEHRPVMVIVDEARAIKNMGTDNFRWVRDFSAGRDLLLLDGTPLTTPKDAYTYLKLIAPGTYRNLQQFENIHVASRDYFKQITGWKNLDLLRENMKVNASRILKEDMLAGLQEPVYIPMYYDLDEAHARLYKQLAQEQLLLLDDGGKIDATQSARLYNCLQQIILNPAHFTGDPKARSVGHDLLDELIEQLELATPKPDGKLLIFCNYRMTNRTITEQLSALGAVAVYSEVSQAQQARNIERFLTDPTCRVLVAHPRSGGQGLNLQHVCRDVLFLECPLVPSQFVQGVGRVYRQGQKHVPMVRIAIAEGTIQVRLHRQLLEKDALVNQVQRAYRDLEEAIYGG